MEPFSVLIAPTFSHFFTGIILIMVVIVLYLLLWLKAQFIFVSSL